MAAGHDLLVKLYDLPAVHDDQPLRDRGIEIKRAFAGDREQVLAFVGENFGKSWVNECAYSLCQQPIRCFIAVQDKQVLGFAYAAPVQGTVTDGFGWRENAFHYGTDIAADAGTVISSFADGTVTAVGDSSQLGNYVTVSHAGAFTTLYAHCSRITASSGQQVALGDPIAEVGETGNATGPHLHFAIQKDTVYLDPAYYGIG